MMGDTMRDAFGKRLAALGAEREDLVVLDADVSSSTKSSYFAQAFPKRFYNVGVAEANMVGVAAGMAAAGYRPVVNAFAIFLSLKCGDQIRNACAYNSLPVVLVGAYGGLSDSFDGASHQSVADIGIMRSIPGLEIIVPADSEEAARALDYALGRDCPVYIRLNRNETAALPAATAQADIRKARKLRAGRDVTIVAAGICSSMALEAAERLAAEGASAEVLSVASIKPLDVDGIAESVERTGLLVTAEEHNIVGGLGAACAEALSERGIPFRLARVGVEDRYTESGPYAAILDKYGISAAAIRAKAVSLLGRNN